LRLAIEDTPASLSAMLKAAAFMVMLVAAPALALAEEGARTDVTTLRTLVMQAARLVQQKPPADLALAVAQVDLSHEIAAALHTRPARVDRLKAP
jgi:hypothetical protein